MKSYKYLIGVCQHHADEIASHIGSLRSLDGARNPEDSSNACLEMCSSARRLREVASELRDRYDAQSNRKSAKKAAR